MAQFDVHENLHSNNDEIPYILDIQHNNLKSLNTRIVIPLALNERITKIVNPMIIVNNTELIMLTSQLAGLPINKLGKKICSLENKRVEIINAIDFIVTGY